MHDKQKENSITLPVGCLYNREVELSSHITLYCYR